MKTRGFCSCEATHDTSHEAVGCIHLVFLDDTDNDGYKVCPPCLGQFMAAIVADRATDLHVAFRVHPVGEPCQ